MPKVGGAVYNQMADYATGNAYFQQHIILKKDFSFSFVAYLASLLYLAFFMARAKKRNKPRFIRGAQLMPLAVLNEKLAADARKHPLSLIKIGETVIPYEMEPKHMLILGTSGSGKGVLISQLVDQINRRKAEKKTGEKCIFYDLKGEYVAKQFSDGDYLFSPFDSRSLGWNIFNEIEDRPDFDIMAKSLFASPSEKDAYWYNCAGEVFLAGLIFLELNHSRTNNDLWNFFSLSVEEMIRQLKRLPLEHQAPIKHIDKTDAPASASIISILQERIQFFKYLTDFEGDFSFRKYIRERAAAPANLFILNVEQYASIFRPLMTLAIDTMIRETLSLPDDLRRRNWFIIDELGTLFKMDSIIKLETVGRSKGGCLICANQDLGRIEEMYGRANLKSFFNNFNTNFTFRIREPETAEFLSKAIGDQQLIKTSQSRQISPSEIGDRRSENDQEKTERLVMPVEFQALNDLEAIVNIAGYGIAQISIPRIFYPEKNTSFILRRFKDLGSLDQAGAGKAASAGDMPFKIPKQQLSR
jgi:type IV secretory pathway TraG/TraD family ATPase VirD4